MASPRFEQILGSKLLGEAATLFVGFLALKWFFGKEKTKR
jgi:hypothetical protein